MNMENKFLSLLFCGLVIFTSGCESDKENNTENLQSNTVYLEETKASTVIVTTSTKTENYDTEYVLNINTKKIHYIDCSSASLIKEENKLFTDDYEEAIDDGYLPCKRCNPTE